MNKLGATSAEYTVIGAGPAGMSVATALSAAGKNVSVLDMAATPGGQIYRQVSQAKTQQTLLGPDYFRGKELTDQFLAADIDYQPNSRVWWLEKDDQGYRLGVKTPISVHTHSTQKLIIATGAIERPMPFNGWQLPGVMTAGSAQILIKQSALVPAAAPVLVGSGPLLFLLAHQLVKAGVTPNTIIDLSPKDAYLQPIKSPVKSWQGRKYLFKGVGLMASLKLAGVNIVCGVSQFKALGDERLESVSYIKNNQTKAIKTDLLLTHFGVIPEPQTARSLNVDYQWHSNQVAFVPKRDSLDFNVGNNLWMIGDCASINGAINAELEGKLLASKLLKQPEPDIREQEKQRNQENAVRPVLEKMFMPPKQWVNSLEADTTVCRCEAIKLADIHSAVDNGAHNANQLKTFTRCGMGACQGRMCGTSVSQIVASKTNTSLDKVGYYRIRTPINPITLGDLSVVNHHQKNKTKNEEIS